MNIYGKFKVTFSTAFVNHSYYIECDNALGGGWNYSKLCHIVVGWVQTSMENAEGSLTCIYFSSLYIMFAGLATAAGCQLVASCDIAVAAENAQFATPGYECRHISLQHIFHLLVTHA